MSDSGGGNIQVEVACALPERQVLLAIEVPQGVSARQAVQLSKIQEHFSELQLAGCVLGVFGKVVADDAKLRDGDRVEVYRPLINDPRDARRKLAARGATMGLSESDDPEQNKA